MKRIQELIEANIPFSFNGKEILVANQPPHGWKPGPQHDPWPTKEWPVGIKPNMTAKQVAEALKTKNPGVEDVKIVHDRMVEFRYGAKKPRSIFKFGDGWKMQSNLPTDSIET